MALRQRDRASVLLTAAIPLTPGRHYEFSKFDLFKRLDPGVSITNSAREPRLEIAYLVPDSINDFRQAKDVTAEFANGNYVVDTPAEGKSSPAPEKGERSGEGTNKPHRRWHHRGRRRPGGGANGGGSAPTPPAAN